MKINPLTAIDFYKADHRRQYPDNTELVYSNFTPRSLKHGPKAAGTEDKVVFFGLQYFIKWFLIETFNDEFFKQPLEKVVAKYKRRMDNALGPDAIPMEHIIGLHNIGYVPVSIRALPEGARVKAQVPVFTVRNTFEEHPTASWITNYLESVISTMNWQSMTSATIADKYRQVLEKYALETVGTVDGVQFQAHDFSFRGMSSIQSAVMSGAGHLLSFVGTDTVPAIDFLEDYYGANSDKELVGCSVPATEHSVMCMGGKEDELETFRRLITKVYPKGIVSIVSDTWDFWKVITEYLPALKTEILARSGGFPVDKVVIRPDSGDPVRIICGDKFVDYTKTAKTIGEAADYAFEDAVDEIGSETPHGECGAQDVDVTFLYQGKAYNVKGDIEWNRHDKQYYYIDGSKMKGFNEVTLTADQKGAIECLWETFGGTITEKGYKLLDSHIGLIYGDSITLARAIEIMDRLKAKGFASLNVVLGVGSFTYQYNTRDTLGFAMKATAGIVDGEVREIFKDPKTDGGGLKKSAKGFLAVRKDEKGEYYLVDQLTLEEAERDTELKEVFRNGKLLIEHTLAEIRARIRQ